MEKNNARNSPSFAFLLIIFGLAIQDAFSQRVKVQPEVVSYPGQTVSLQCEYPNQSGTALTQVSWIWEPADGKRDNIAVYHPDFGPSYPSSPLIGRVTFVKPSLTNPSITISDVKMTDEGRYICEYATYPSGNEQGTTTLIMLAKPENNGSAITAVAGNTSTVVARCQSANGRPPAKITWISPFNGNDTVVTKPGTSNTVTVISEYRLVPTAADDGKEIKCVIEHRTQSKNEEISMKLAIEYLPKVSITGYDENWYMGRSSATLMCQAFGNPPPSIAWKTTSGPLPANVQVQEAYLTVPKVDDTMNTTFVCEATNQRGTASHHLTVMVRDGPVNSSNAGVVAGAVIGSLLAVLLVGALVAVLVTRHRQHGQGYRGNGNQGTYETRIFGGKKTSKNGTGGNNNGPIYTYRDGDPEAMTEKSNHINRTEGVMVTTPTAQDILLSGEMDEVERRKFDDLEDAEEERYVHFGGEESILQIRPHEEVGGYLDDDMESQRDGSVISRTAVYV
uniref:Si:ch73-22o12.1 n=1 Tax=Paramormyrops kingsleyae TaxID=1676925 RepID=A0A3B3T9B6_9TELE|nr:nectin-2 isoform X1 [Paramormyrops kingsleyae]